MEPIIIVEFWPNIDIYDTSTYDNLITQLIITKLSIFECNQDFAFHSVFWKQTQVDELKTMCCIMYFVLFYMNKYTSLPIYTQFYYRMAAVDDKYRSK